MNNLHVKYSFTMGIKLHIISSGSSMSSSTNNLSNHTHKMKIRFSILYCIIHDTYFACFEVSSSFTASYIWNRSFAAFSEELCTLTAASGSIKSHLLVVYALTLEVRPHPLWLCFDELLCILLYEMHPSSRFVSLHILFKNDVMEYKTFCSLTRRSFRSSMEVGVCGLLVPGWIRLEMRSYGWKNRLLILSMCWIDPCCTLSFFASSRFKKLFCSTVSARRNKVGRAVADTKKKQKQTVMISICERSSSIHVCQSNYHSGRSFAFHYSSLYASHFLDERLDKDILCNHVIAKKNNSD